jgi:2-polyprenyl-3-methyl-5-hydroxy-6-metoxy-1,4-benzoquinol methylase
VTETPPRPFAISENIYGHLKRLRWIISHLRKDDAIVELGCGTGYMITLPLARLGYRVIGVDLDEPSIAYGRELFRQAGLDPSYLHAGDLADLDVAADVIIASEVLEHVHDDDLGRALRIVRSKLKPGGRLLVTVPNGYGWFEIESPLWFKLGIGKLLEWLQIVRATCVAKRLLFGRHLHRGPVSTLSTSPHVQRFTYRSIQDLLSRQGFRIEAVTGSVLFAGPFSDLFFTGIRPIMRLNCRLGDRFPRLAAAFFVSCRK